MTRNQDTLMSNLMSNGSACHFERLDQPAYRASDLQFRPVGLAGFEPTTP